VEEDEDEQAATPLATATTARAAPRLRRPLSVMYMCVFFLSFRG
jgi:hypothetical protein